MVFDGQKYHLIFSEQIQDKIIVHHKLAKVIVPFQRSFEFSKQLLGFFRVDGVFEKQTARLGKLAQGWDHIVK